MKIFLGVCLFAIALVVNFVASTVTAMLAWNWFMPHVFPEVPKLSFWMAVILAFAITGFHPTSKDCKHNQDDKNDSFNVVFCNNIVEVLFNRGVTIAILFVIQFLAFN